MIIEPLDMVVPCLSVLLVAFAFGFAPKSCLRLIVRAFPPSDPRRAELLAEIRAVPYGQRPQWVAEQLEVALFEGLPHRLAALRRWFTLRRRGEVQPDGKAARRADGEAAKEADSQSAMHLDDREMKRRKLLSHGAAMLFGTTVFGEEMGEWLTSVALTPAPSHIGLTDVKRVEAATRAMRQLDYQFGGGACRDAVVAQLSWAQRLLSASCPEGVRQRLFRALADLQNLAGLKETTASVERDPFGDSVCPTCSTAILVVHRGGRRCVPE